MCGIGVQLCDNCRQYFGKMFSDNTEVVRLVGKVMPLVASFQVRLIPNVFETSPLTVMLLDRRRPCEFLWRGSAWARRAYNPDYRRISHHTHIAHRSTAPGCTIQSRCILCSSSPDGDHTSVPSAHSSWLTRLMDR